MSQLEFVLWQLRSACGTDETLDALRSAVILLLEKEMEKEASE